MLPRNSRSARALLVESVGGSIALALATNALVFGLGWNQPQASAAAPRFAPPDGVVGAVWVALFASLGFARYAIVRTPAPHTVRDARLVVALIVFCASYPLYTLGLSNLIIATAGNVATLWASLAVARRVRTEHPLAARCIVPVAAWLAFATYLTASALL